MVVGMSADGGGCCRFCLVVVCCCAVTTDQECHGEPRDKLV